MAHFSFSLSIILLFCFSLFGSIEDYLIPKDHSLLPKLNAIFASGVTNSQETLQKAGFNIVTKGHYSRAVVATHSDVPGYFFKLFTDDQGIDELENLMKRIHGAELAKAIIANHGWEQYLKVPQKWIYQSGAKYILIAEDMDIYSKNKNLSIWASKKVTKERLDVLYAFLTEGGFADNIHYFNLPFSRDGRWALIDTEKYHTWPIPYHILTKRLRYKMQVYWVNLTN